VDEGAVTRGLPRRREPGDVDRSEDKRDSFRQNHCSPYLRLLHQFLLRIRMASQDFVTANNGFGITLFKKIAEEKKGENVFISPFSISVALSMTQLGARGLTASQMSSTLQWPGEGEAVHQGYQTYLTALQKPCDMYQLNTANRIYIEKKYPVLGEFLEKTKKFYLAEPVSADFSKQFESERQQINSWVMQQTQDKIKDLLPDGSLDTLTRMVLVNAIYFKGKWHEEFKPQHTQQLPFKISASLGSKDVPMMFAKRKFHYIEDELLACKALEIPYKGKELSMVVILPNADFGLEDLIRNLSLDHLTRLLQSLGQSREMDVKLTLPKFEMTSSVSLKSHLTSLGMSEAFSEQTADFSGMTQGDLRDLFISEVFHKAFVKVNEEGTEAAAAMCGTMMLLCGRIDPEMEIDHPFLFVIMDKQSRENLLFLGVVADPSTH